MSETIIDTHSHVYLPDFKEDIKIVVDNFLAKNIQKIVLPNIDLTSADQLFTLKSQYPSIFHCAIGLHPCSVTASFNEDLKKLKLLIDKNTVAIGETGIDLYWDKSLLKEQISSFQTQINWSLEYAIPIIIHVRDSFNEVFNAIDEVYKPALTGVFHCFTGDENQAKKALSYSNFYLGIGGVVTYKNTTLREVLKSNVPIERIVLETDAPYLSPVPYRGKRNEPAYIVEVAKTIAEVYNLTYDEVAAITTSNAKKLFAI